MFHFQPVTLDFNRATTRGSIAAHEKSIDPFYRAVNFTRVVKKARTGPIIVREVYFSPFRAYAARYHRKGI